MEQKDYTTEDLVTVFSGDFIDLLICSTSAMSSSQNHPSQQSQLVYLFLIRVIASLKDYGIVYFENCSPSGEQLISQLISQTQQVIPIATPQNSQPPKIIFLAL